MTSWQSKIEIKYFLKISCVKIGHLKMRVHMKTRHFHTQTRRHIDLIHDVNALMRVEMSQVASNMHVGCLSFFFAICL